MMTDYNGRQEMVIAHMAFGQTSLKVENSPIYQPQKSPIIKNTKWQKIF